MFGVRTLHRHAAMMDRMGRTLGVDLNRALATGQLCGETWRDAVTRCTGCAAPEACLHWLAACEGAVAAAAPGYCCNSDLIERLRAGGGEADVPARNLQGA